jgi:hypothetical protein
MEICVWPIFAAVAEQRSVRQFALTFRELPPLFFMTTKGRQNLPMCRSIYPNGALPRIVPVEVTSMMPMILLPLAVCATTRMKYQTWALNKGAEDQTGPPSVGIGTTVPRLCRDHLTGALRQPLRLIGRKGTWESMPGSRANRKQTADVIMSGPFCFSTSRSSRVRRIYRDR